MGFASSMEAKQFLVSRIVEEARRRHVALSELEQKMLYFSENYPTLPDMMEVIRKFETEFDSEKYEEKIKRLSRRAFKRDQKQSPQDTQLWREAIKILKKEDHYILVMLDVPRSASDIVKLVVAGLLVTLLLVGAVAAYHWAGEKIHFRVPDYIGYPSALLGFVILYYLASTDKSEKLGKWLGDVTERVARWF